MIETVFSHTTTSCVVVTVVYFVRAMARVKTPKRPVSESTSNVLIVLGINPFSRLLLNYFKKPLHPLLPT